MTPWTAAYQAPPSMGFSRQEYWSGVPLPSPNRVVNTAQMKLCEHPSPSYIVKSVRLLKEMISKQNSEREVGVYQEKKTN